MEVRSAQRVVSVRWCCGCHLAWEKLRRLFNLRQKPINEPLRIGSHGDRSGPGRVRRCACWNPHVKRSNVLTLGDGIVEQPQLTDGQANSLFGGRDGEKRCVEFCPAVE